MANEATGGQGNSAGSPGGGQVQAPVGTVPSGGGADTGVGGGGGGMASGMNAAPSVVDIADDQLIRVPGSKDPVKYGEWYRSFQADYTRKSQEAARLKQELARIQREQQQAGQRQQQQGQPAAKPNPLGELAQQVRSLQYLSGQDAERVVQSIAERISAVDGELERRDLALGLMYNQLQQAIQSLNGIQNRTTQSDFDMRIKNWCRECGLPEGAEDFAREVYLAYEPGEELDQEFPTILKNRWTAIQNLLKTERQRTAQEARNRPFVPTRGGQGAAGKPLQDLARASSRQVADALWPGDSGFEA